MIKTLAALATAGTLGIAAISAPTAAEAHYWHGPGVAAGVLGGLAAGALIGSAIAGPYAYYGPYGYYGYSGPAWAYAPGPYYGGHCYLHRERLWDGHVRHVRVCD